MGGSIRKRCRRREYGGEISHPRGDCAQWAPTIARTMMMLKTVTPARQAVPFGADIRIGSIFQRNLNQFSNRDMRTHQSQRELKTGIPSPAGKRIRFSTRTADG